MYLRRDSQANITTKLGEKLLTSIGGSVYENLIIEPKINNQAWANILSKALANGTISQSDYDDINENQNNERQVYQQSTITIDKTELIELIDNYGVQGIETGGTSADIITSLNSNGLQVIL